MAHSERFLKLVDDARSRVAEVTPEEAKARCEADAGVLLVDVREESEWAAGHIAGAVHLGKGIIERDIERLVPELDREVILYCGGGFRSALAAENLARMGYTHVASMLEGWRGWNERGFPVEKG